MVNERYELSVSAASKAVSLQQRIADVTRLLEIDPELALHTVLKITEDPTEDPETLRAMGRQLDIIAAAHRFPTEFEIRDMCNIAYDSFCEPRRGARAYAAGLRAEHEKAGRLAYETGRS